MNIPHDLLARALDESFDGITIVDAQRQELPLVYVNQGFEKLTGYTADEVLGKSYQFLYGTDTGQPEIATIRAATNKGQGCAVKLRTYQKNGTMFWSQFSISPVHDDGGTLTHFIGIHRDATEKVRLETLVYTDPLVGIANRRRFDERFAELLHVAQRTHSGMSLLMIDLDQFRQFNERYGQSAGDECLRMVGDCIAKSFHRMSDCVARYGGEEFAVVSFSTGIEVLRVHAQKLCEQVRMLNIPHSDSPHGVVTISIGGIHRLPSLDTTEEEWIDLVNQQLLAAKHSGRDRVHIIG